MEEELREGVHKENYFQQVVQDAIEDLKETGNGYCFLSSQIREIESEVPNLVYKLVDGIYYLSINDKDDDKNEYFAVKVEKKWMYIHLKPSGFIYQLFQDVGVKFKSFKSEKYLKKFLSCKKTRNAKNVEKALYVVFNRHHEICPYFINNNVLEMVFNEYNIKYVEFKDENDLGYISIIESNNVWKGGDTNEI